MYIDSKKNNILDGLIYNNSGQTSIIDKKNYKRYLSTKKMNKISDIDPIIIGGCPRSGTTLARALIGSHPDIASAEQEYNLLMWIDKAEILKRVFEFNSEETRTFAQSIAANTANASPSIFVTWKVFSKKIQK